MHDLEMNIEFHLYLIITLNFQYIHQIKLFKFPKVTILLSMIIISLVFRNQLFFFYSNIYICT